VCTSYRKPIPGARGQSTPPLDVWFLRKVWQTFSCLQSVRSQSAHNEENDCARLTANPFQGHAASRPPLDVWFLQKVWQTFSFLQSVWSQSAHNEHNDCVRLTANPFQGHADSQPPPCTCGFFKKSGRLLDLCRLSGDCLHILNIRLLCVRRLSPCTFMTQSKVWRLSAHIEHKRLLCVRRLSPCTFMTQSKQLLREASVRTCIPYL
jgi:hypothetical protein